VRNRARKKRTGEEEGKSYSSRFPRKSDLLGNKGGRRKKKKKKKVDIGKRKRKRTGRRQPQSFSFKGA